MSERTHAQVLEALLASVSRRHGDWPLIGEDEVEAITACLDALRKARRTIYDMGTMPCRKEGCDCVLAALDAVLGRQRAAPHAARFARAARKVTLKE